MSSYLTSDTLIDSIIRRAAIPQSEVTFQTEDFLAFANEEMMIGLVPTVMMYHEEFFVYATNIPIVSNQDAYEIPDRAVGNKIRSLFSVDSLGNPREMARISPDDIVYYQRRSQVNYPSVFYLMNNTFVCVPTVGPNPTGGFLVKYFQRPNQLVTSDRISTVTGIDTVNGIVTVNTLPSVFTSGSNKFDLMETKGGHRSIAIDLVPTSIDTTTNTITFGAGNVPSTLALGDMVTLAGECYIPQLPDDLHAVLAQRVACRCLEAIGDTIGLQNANAKLQEMEHLVATLVDNRTEGQPKKVNNLRSPLRFSKMSYKRITI